MHEEHRKRMIDKLFKGKEILSDHEILEILLFYSIPRKNVNEVAHRLLDKYGSLKNCLSADKEDYLQIDGIGLKTADFLIIIGQVYKRIQDFRNKVPLIFTRENGVQMLKNCYRYLDEEKLIFIFLDGNSKVVLTKVLVKAEVCGDVDGYMSHLLKGAVVKRPYAVVISQNRLSGDCMPNEEDDRITEKVYMALRLQNIHLSDHIIIAGDNAYSYRDSGKLKTIAIVMDRFLF